MTKAPLEVPSYRRAIGTFATGVAVVTTLDETRAPVGITVNSLTSLSLDPPSLLWCLGDDAVHHAVFASAREFMVNVLSDTQDDLSNRFADPSGPSWEGVSWRPAEEGLPRLTGSLATIACETMSQWRHGDHLVIVGRVSAARTEDPGVPLLYYRGGYGISSSMGSKSGSA